MTQNSNNSGTGLVFWVILGFILYISWLFGASKRNNIQQSPTIMGAPQQTNGINLNDILREQIRQNGATARQMLQPQQLPAFDPNNAPQQQQCVYSLDAYGNLVQVCK